MNSVLPDQEQDIVADLNALGPGDRLRNARLALDIDVSKLANRLHLTTDVVEALERDDYSDMTARVFVRGYLSNYAREVNLPVDSVLEQFDQIWPESERPVKITTPPRLASDSRPGNRWSTLFTWLVVLSGVALFLIWWQGYLDDFLDQQRQGQAADPMTESATSGDTTNNGLPAFMQPEPAQAPADATGTQDSGSAGDPSTQAGSAADPGSAPGASNPAQPASASEGTSPAQPGNDAASTISPGGVREITIDQSGETAEPASNEEVVMELRPVEQTPAAAEPGVAEPAATAPAAALDPNAVTISFSGLCWVDIRDSTRTFKLVGEMNEGESHQLGGEAPYSMIIGNARAAQVSVGGTPYDLRPHTNGNVARLTLNP